MTHTPIQIRPHLVSFFFKEIDGEEVHYLNTRAKSVKLYFSSSINKLLRLLLSKTDYPVRLDTHYMLLTISNKNEYKGSIYKIDDDKRYFLSYPPEVNEDINNLLEDYFRVAFVFYVYGHVENSKECSITAAILKFMQTYELEEFGFDYETLRRFYYREINKFGLLTRITKKTK